MNTLTAKEFGELELAFIDGTNMALAWSDQKSDGKYDGAFYNPDFEKLGSVADGYYYLGSFGINSYATPLNGWILLVKPSPSNLATKPALRLPDRFEFIWTDKGSGATLTGSFWLPVSDDPDYVACGTLCVRGGSGANPDPKTARIMMVRRDLTEQGVVGDFIWNDEKTGSKSQFSAWNIDVPKGSYLLGTKMLMAPNCVIGVPTRTKPESGKQVNVLKLSLTYERKSRPNPPTLTDPTQPPQYSNPELVATVLVPFTAVVDKGLTVQQQIDKSPFYHIARLQGYELWFYQHNDSTSAQQQTYQTQTGVTVEQSQTFSIGAGVEVSYEAGVDIGIASEKVGGKVSLALGYETSTRVAAFQVYTVTQVFNIPAKSAFAVWNNVDVIAVGRLDQTPICRPLVFQDTGNCTTSSCPIG